MITQKEQFDKKDFKKSFLLNTRRGLFDAFVRVTVVRTGKKNVTNFINNLMEREVKKALKEGIIKRHY